MRIRPGVGRRVPSLWEQFPVNRQLLTMLASMVDPQKLAAVGYAELPSERVTVHTHRPGRDAELSADLLIS